MQGWRQTIAGISVQEMGHLAIVSNLLTSLGTAPHLATAALGLMRGAIDPLGRALTTLPACPVFWPAAWALLRERLVELSAYAQELSTHARSPSFTLTRVRLALDEAATALTIEA